MRESYTNRRAFHHVECYIQHSEILLCFTTRRKRLAGKPNDRPQIDQKSRTRTLCSASLAGTANLVAARRLSLHGNPQAPPCCASCTLLSRPGVVSRRLADGQYRISANQSHLTRKPDCYHRVAEAAAPVLDRLCRKISWPSDLMVPAGDHMEDPRVQPRADPILNLFHARQ